MPLAQVPGGFVPGVLTSAALNAGLLVGRPLFVRKTADQSVTSSTTYTDDTELYGDVAANCTYHFVLEAFYTAIAAANMKTKFTYPAGSSIVSASFLGNWWGAFTFSVCGTDGEANTIDGKTTAAPFTIFGLLVTGGTAGEFQVQWAQNTSNATATKMLAGSRLTLVRCE